MLETQSRNLRALRAQLAWFVRDSRKRKVNTFCACCDETLHFKKRKKVLIDLYQLVFIVWVRKTKKNMCLCRAQTVAASRAQQNAPPWPSHPCPHPRQPPRPSHPCPHPHQPTRARHPCPHPHQPPRLQHKINTS